MAWEVEFGILRISEVNKLKINFFALPGRRTEEHLLEDDDSLFLDDTVPGTPYYRTGRLPV
jgi:hypothetical protein